MYEGAPVAVGMTIDVASIDMVSEVNMVSVYSVFFYFLRVTNNCTMIVVFFFTFCELVK